MNFTLGINVTLKRVRVMFIPLQLSNNLIPFHPERDLNVAGVNKTYYGLHVKCPTFLSNCELNWNFEADFVWNTKFQENPSSGRRDRSCGHEDDKSSFSRESEHALKHIQIPICIIQRHTSATPVLQQRIRPEKDHAWYADEGSGRGGRNLYQDTLKSF